MLGDKDLSAGEQPGATPEPAAQPEQSGVTPRSSGETNLPDVVMVQDASGKRHPFAFADAAVEPLVLVFPDSFAGQCIALTLWRRIDGQREQEPWMTLRPRVRDDATLPMAGIASGRYDIEAGLPEQPRILVEDQPAPGEVSFALATPIR